jgi:hypothetical protein
MARPAILPAGHAAPRTATRAAEILLDGEARALTRKAVDLALGDAYPRSGKNR